MKKIKKISLALALSLLISTSFTAPKAEAGVMTVIGGLAGNSIGGIALGALVSWGGFAILETVAQDNPWRIAGLVLIVLDAKQPLTNDGIEQFLAQRYPFIDDREVISDLANLMRTKIVSCGAINTSMMVSIPEQEVRSILANSSLSAAQTETLVTALK